MVIELFNKTADIVISESEEYFNNGFITETKLFLTCILKSYVFLISNCPDKSGILIYNLLLKLELLEFRAIQFSRQEGLSVFSFDDYWSKVKEKTDKIKLILHEEALSLKYSSDKHIKSLVMKYSFEEDFQEIDSKIDYTMDASFHKDVMKFFSQISYGLLN